jgi:hypothetical protein
VPNGVVSVIAAGHLFDVDMHPPSRKPARLPFDKQPVVIRADKDFPA